MVVSAKIISHAFNRKFLMKIFIDNHYKNLYLFLSLLKHACGKQQPTTMFTVKWSAGVAPDVNLKEH